MNKFKAFFTFLAFLWLCLCGFWGIYALFGSGNAAWAGLVINAFALPLWMLIRYLLPEKTASDLRESPAFAGVLLGLGFALLADAQKGLPLYLAIYNLFVVLIYLFHLSTIGHSRLPAVGAHFPVLTVCNHASGNPAELCRKVGEKGVLVVFLRGAFCAGSRTLLGQLHKLEMRLKEREVSLLVVGAQPRLQWPRFGMGEFSYWQADPKAQENASFVAGFGAPLLLWPRQKEAVRPSAWLLDCEGTVIWRHLPGNYRVPGTAALFADQLYRLDD